MQATHVCMSVIIVVNIQRNHATSSSGMYTHLSPPENALPTAQPIQNHVTMVASSDHCGESLSCGIGGILMAVAAVRALVLHDSDVEYASHARLCCVDHT